MQNRKPHMAALHRRHILDAATSVFADKGFDKASMDEIAQVAGYTKRTIYAYFPSKDSIQMTIVLEGFVALRDRLRAVIDADLAVTLTYRGLLDAALNEQTEQPYRTASMLRFSAPPLPKDQAPTTEAGRDIARLVGMIMDVGVELDTLMIEVFEKGKQAGVVRTQIDARLAGMVVWAEISAIANLLSHKAGHLLAELDLGEEAFRSLACDLILNGVLVDPPTQGDGK